MLGGAKFSHRRYIWRTARETANPSREQWRYILLGRWSGF